MEILIKIAQFLLSLSILIILHELGHYIAARIFKTRVEKFYLFFDAWGKKLFSFKRGDTEYGVGWLPLGGYVKISGMIDESMDKEQLKQEPKPYEFRTKPAWQRLIIMLAGVAVNLILALFIYIMIVGVWGEEYSKPEDITYGFAITDNFKKYGFKDGDKITHINRKEPFDVTNVNKHLLFKKVENISVTHEDGATETITLPKSIGKIMWEEGTLNPFVPRFLPIIDSIYSKSSAEKAGLKEGDIVQAVNGIPVSYTYQVNKLIDSTAFDMTIRRNNEELTLHIVPEYIKKHKIYRVGMEYDLLKSFKTRHKKYKTLDEKITRGHQLGLSALNDFIVQFKYLFTKKGAREIGGFIAIGNIFPAKWDWQIFWRITAFLSIMLGILNLLPIPVLDGGHALFVIFEMITGHKPSDKFLERAQIVGFIILLALLLWANGNDIYKLIKGWLG